MTEPAAGAAAEAAQALSRIVRASGHELRNALNALVVNLEVVRARTTDPTTRQFAEQAVQQSEESARLAESAIALLNLLAGAVEDGSVRSATGPSGTVSIQANETEVDRIVRALASLAGRGVVSVDRSGSAVILSIPDTPESQIKE